MKKRGFTLIELLAVIVILAIIALIAIPIVMNVIENSKKGAAERTAENIEAAAELYYYENRINGLFPGITFICKNGSCASDDKVLQINGTAPELGSITIDKEGIVTLNSIVINGYNCYKKNESYSCEKLTKAIVESTNGVLTFDSKTTEFSNLIMYGNKANGVGNKTKNLLDKNLSQIGYFNHYATAKGTDINGSTLWSDFTKYTGQQCNVNWDFCWYVTNPIPIKPNTVYSYSGFHSANNPAYFFLEEDKTTIINGKVIKGSGTFTTPDNARYIVMSIRSDHLDTIMLQEGEITDYEPYGYNIPIKVTGKNLFDLNKITIEKPYNNDKPAEIIDNGIKVYQSYAHKSAIYNFIPDVDMSVTFSYQATSTQDYRGYVWIMVNDKEYYNVKSGHVLNLKAGDNVVIQFAWYKNYSDYVKTGLEEVTFTDIQLETGETATSYEPYKEVNYTITLSEPLRCVDNVCDYVDFRSGKVVRNVKVESDGSLVKLEKSISEDIDLPNIKLNSGVNNIYVETNFKPSKLELEYYK